MICAIGLQTGPEYIPDPKRRVWKPRNPIRIMQPDSHVETVQSGDLVPMEQIANARPESWKDPPNPAEVSPAQLIDQCLRSVDERLAFLGRELTPPNECFHLVDERFELITGDRLLAPLEARQGCV